MPAKSTRKRAKTRTVRYDVAAQVARAAGLSRESLYRALSAGGNPSFATILKVTRALGVRLHAEPV
ncbi:MAG: putative addiction module antidote protein [Gammaproteobacteria bacterium]|nr:putative addiction module antidote protein [Gammaproteobacteria bacterium]